MIRTDIQDADLADTSMICSLFSGQTIILIFSTYWLLSCNIFFWGGIIVLPIFKLCSRERIHYDSYTKYIAFHRYVCLLFRHKFLDNNFWIISYNFWASTSLCAPVHATLDRRPSHCCACHFGRHHLPDYRSALPHLWLRTHCHLLC